MLPVSNGETMTEADLYFRARAAGWDPTPWESPAVGEADTDVQLADGWREAATAVLEPTVAPTFVDVWRDAASAGPKPPAPFADVLGGSATWSIAGGDCLAGLLRLPSACVDAVVTDPPYSRGGQFRADREGGNRKYLSSGPDQERGADAYPDFEGDSRDQRSYLLWSTMWLDAARRATKDGGICVVFTDWRQLPTTTDALQAGGWIWRGIVPWLKPSHRPQKGRFAAGAEYIVWGSKGALPADGECHPGFFLEQPPREREHPTEKPEALMRGVIQIVPRGGIVLDPFVGSGTTLVAAVTEGRRAIGFESSPDYLAIARRRCTDLATLRDRWVSQQQGALFGAGGQP